MKVNFETCDCGNYECMITDPHEVDIVKQYEMDEHHVSPMQMDDPDEDYGDNLCVGGFWYYSLLDLHNLVGKGVELSGLPSWMAIS